MLTIGMVFVNYRGKGTPGTSEKEAGRSVEKDEGIAINNIHYYGTSNNRLEWELKADSATGPAALDMLTLSGVTFFHHADAKGKTRRIDGKNGRLDALNDTVEISGGVVLSSLSEGYSIRTEDVTYSTRDHVVTAPGSVEFAGREFSARGVGMRMDMDAEKVALLKDARTVFKGAKLRR